MAQRILTVRKIKEILRMKWACRRDGRTQRRLKAAGFPMQATIEDLDFSPERGLDRRLILELSQCTWVDKALNILLLGATGTGKTQPEQYPNKYNIIYSRDGDSYRSLSPVV